MKNPSPQKQVHKTPPLKVSRPRLPPATGKPHISLLEVEAFQSGFQQGYAAATRDLNRNTEGTTATEKISTR